MKTNKLLALLRDNARAEGPAPLRIVASSGESHVYIYDVIDSWFGASAQALTTALAEAGDNTTIHLHINSPGGDVFEARAMAAALVAHKGKVVSHIDGMAASAATYLALAANEVRMTDGGLFMVHNSWTLAMGDKAELLKTADLLDKIDQTIAANYTAKTGADLATVQAWMDAETWFTAQEALDAKFIDGIDANTKADNSGDSADPVSKASQWNLSAYANAPKLPTPPAGPDQDQLTAQAAAQTQRNRNRLRLLSPI